MRHACGEDKAKQSQNTRNQCINARPSTFTPRDRAATHAEAVALVPAATARPRASVAPPPRLPQERPAQGHGMPWMRASDARRKPACCRSERRRKTPRGSHWRSYGSLWHRMIENVLTGAWKENDIILFPCPYVSKNDKNPCQPSRAATPGRVLPSIHSRNAPPAEET